MGNRLRVLQVEHQRKGILRIHQRVWKFFQSRKASNVVTGFGTVALLGVTVFAYSQSMPTTTAPPTGTTGGGNVFPYGSCTWWADQRYFQLHGVFVPWHTQANAWEWTARAYEFGWHVSSKPVVGAIIDLQSGVQGASGLGHVAVVEKILSNGHVIASNMSWGAYPWQVTDVEFTPGPGVTFIFR